MNFSHTEEQQMLTALLERYFQEKYPFAARQQAAYGAQGFSRERWKELAELGLTAALFRPEWGGYGGDGFDVMIAFEALGRALAVEPFLGSLMVGHALAMAGHPKLQAVVTGQVIVALAHQERQGDTIEALTTRAARDGSGWILTGAKAVVPQAESADWFLISAQAPAGLTVFIVPARAAGLSIHGYLNIEGGRSGDLLLEDVRVGDDALVGNEAGGIPLLERAIDAGLLALSAEALGIMDVLQTTTLDYLRTRIQFGQPIGKFQALQHRMADLSLELEQARSSVINGAAAFNGGDAVQTRLALSAAKYTIGATGTLVAQEAIQLHGAIGMTWELPLSHYAKRLVMIGHQLGDEDYHLARFILASRARHSAQARS
jgi:alkylation response protein AidB-like acyl-CoA dehydrogenase